MSSTELSPRFVLFVIVSLLTHLLELAAGALLCHVIMRDADLRSPWFSVAAGLLILPLVAVQLASAVLVLRRRGDSASGGETVATAVLHVLQLGVVSRHFSALQDTPLASKRAELGELLRLRLGFALTSGCCLGLLQAYLVLRGQNGETWAWVVIAGVTLISVTWCLATFCRALPEQDLDRGLLTWPGTPLKLIWRAGEILTRIIALGLFASLYIHWILLVVGLHWIAMLACVCTPAIAAIDMQEASLLRRAVVCIATSFAYIFAFLNTSRENAVCRYTFFYVLLFLENVTLIAVWLLQCSSSELSQNSPYVITAAVAFVASITSMIIYHKFFHVVIERKPEITPAVTIESGSGCETCKHGPGSTSSHSITSTSTRPPIPPRPGESVSANWLNQYQSAVYRGQYYKHTAQDSLLDSVSDLNSTLTAGSSTHAILQKKLAHEITGVKKQPKNEPLRADALHSKSSGIKSRKRSPMKRREKSSRNTDSDIMSSTTDADHSEDSSSPRRPVWLPSGDTNSFANQLLTYNLENFDTAHAADDERSSTGNRSSANPTQYRQAEGKSSLVSIDDKVSISANLDPHLGIHCYQAGVDHHWYSDGYSTDRTLDWPRQLQRGSALHNSSDLPGGHGCPECFHEVSTVLPDGHQEHQPCRHGGREGYRKHSREGKMSSKHQKSPRLPSPASDPSHGPRIKKKHANRKRQQTQEASPSLSNSQSARHLKDKSHHHALQTTTVSSQDVPQKQSNQTEEDSSVSINVGKRIANFDDVTEDSVKPVPDKLSLYNEKTRLDAIREVSPSHHQGDQPTDSFSDASNMQKPTESPVKSEIIYENIWQTKTNKVHGSELISPRTSKVRGRDAWYVCSESEDSALPQEALSSSVDGFTASDSDASVEIVI